MSYSRGSHKGVNHHYWELPEGLPTGKEETVVKNFDLHNESWKYYAQYSSESDMLGIELNCISSSDASFDVQFEILIMGDYRNSIVSKAIGSTSPFIGMDLISRPRLDLLKLENNSLYFFIEIKAKNKGKASKREEEEKAHKMKASK